MMSSKRAFLAGVLACFMLSLAACGSDVPILGKWRAQSISGFDIRAVGIEVEFRPDAIVLLGSSGPVTYEIRDGAVDVVGNGRHMLVTVLDRDHISIEGVKYVRVGSSAAEDNAASKPGQDDGLLAPIIGIFGEKKPASGPTAAPTKEGWFSGLWAAWDGLFGETPKTNTPKPTVNAPQPQPAAPKAAVPATVVRPLSLAEPVSDLQALPKADWQEVARYHAGKQANPSKGYLGAWYGLRHCIAYQKARNDEFAMAELLKEAKLDLAATKADRRMRVSLDLALGEYDFDKSAFALKDFTGKGRINISLSDTSCYAVLSDWPSDLPRSFTLVLDEDVSWQPLVPMTSEAARSLVQEFKAKGNRDVFADLVVDLGDMERETIKARTVALYLWKDEKRRVFLGALGAAQPGSEAAKVQAEVAPKPDAKAEQTSSPANPAPEPSLPAVKPSTPQPALIKPTILSGKATVVDTATLKIADRKVKLAGIEGLGGAYAAQFQTFLDSQGGQAICTPSGDRYSCVTTKGTNLAEAALLNGAARAEATASPRLKTLEQEARSTHRGVWTK